MADRVGGEYLNRTERCNGCDYFGNRSFAWLSSDSRELRPDDAFLRIFPFCRGKTPLLFSFWLDGIICSQDDRQQIMDACEIVCTAPEGSLFSTAPLIISSKDERVAASCIYGMVFHTSGAGMCSLCLAVLDDAVIGGTPNRSPPDWSCLDFMNEAVLIAGPDARVQWANRVARRELFPAGMQVGAAVSAFWKRVLWGDDGSCPLQEFIPVCGVKSPKDLFVEDTRGKFWRVRTGLMAYPEKSSHAGYILTAFEMTEWVARRAKLSEKQNTFAAFMEHLSSSAVIMNLNGEILYCNPPMKEYFRKKGYPDGAGSYTFSPEIVTSLKELFPDVLKKGCLTVERRHTEAKRHDEIYQVTYFPIPHSGPSPLIGSIAVDLTEKRKNEVERAALAATLSEAQKAARLGSWEYDDETDAITFRGIIPGTLAIRDESVSSPLEEFLRSLRPEDAAQVRQAVCGRSADVLHELTVPLNTPEGKIKFAAFRARSRTDGISGTVGTIQDVTETVMAENARVKSEEWFRLYFESSMSGSMIIEPLFSETGEFNNFRFIAVNWSFARMMGAEQESFIGKMASEVFPEDAGTLVSVFHDVVMEGDSYNGEWTCSRNGRVFSGYIFRLGVSQPNYGCSFIDVSCEREALRVLKDNDEFLNIIFPSTIEGILVIDAETHTILDVNATACDLIGAGRDEIISRPCHDIVCPVWGGLCPVTDLGEEVHMSDGMLLTAGGGKIPILKSVKQVVYQGRHCLIEMIVDLRKVKAAENALDIAEERYRMVFETSPDAIVITDTKGISEANPAFGTALGYLPEEMKGCSVLDFSQEWQEDGVRSSHRRNEVLGEIMSGRQISTRWDALSKDGQAVCFEVRGGLVNIFGKAMVILVGRNVTELIHLKKQQREALDQIEENLTNLAILNDHIRNPLMIISGYTEMSAGEHTPVIMSQIQEIDGIIKTLDQGFLESEKIRHFLRRHHDVCTPRREYTRDMF